MRKIGTVLENEKKEIQNIYEKKNALENLIKVLSSEENDLYEKVLNDYTQINTEYLKWWDKMFNKYNWPDGEYRINFKNNEICLVD